MAKNKTSGNGNGNGERRSPQGRKDDRSESFNKEAPKFNPNTDKKDKSN